MLCWNKWVALCVVAAALPCQGSDELKAMPKPGATDGRTSAQVDACKLTRSEEEMARCVEQKIYDPCDFGGGPRSWIHSQCARAHAAVAEKRLRRAEAEIVSRLRKSGRPAVASKFEAAQSKWREFTDTYCRVVNDVNASEAFEAGADYLSYGFCIRRLNEQRATELENYIEKR